jgi:hypothetical protein
MRGLPGELRSVGCLLLMSLLCGGAIGSAQLQEPNLPAPPGQSQPRTPTFGQPGQEGSPDPSMRRAELEAARRRNIERQTKMVADSDKICLLAQQFSDEVNKSSQESLSPAALKKIEEIEKLAKGVKDRMRSE